MKLALILAMASLFSGALFCLALPPADFWFFGWVAFSPLMVVVKGRGFLYGFGGGLLALFTTAFLVRSGLFYANRAFIGEDGWIMTGCGLFGFVASILLGFWADKGAIKPIWWYAALAVLLEACLLVVLPAHLALTQYRQHLLLWLSSLGGIWLVSFLMWIANMGVAEAVMGKDWRKALAPALGLIVVALMQPMIGNREETGIAFGLVQTDKSDAAALGAMHRKASFDSRTIVVWPEFAGLGLASGGNTKPLQEAAERNGGAPFVTSYNDDFKPKPHNVASLVSSTGTSASYFKRKLFGGEKQMHTPGDSAVAVDSPQGRIALGICFDSCYPSIVREAANLPGVVAMALPTIDPESPHHFIAAIHAAFTPFRAAENGIAIARADGFAYSMIVDGRGRIVKLLPPGESTANVGAALGGITLYRRLGDWFLYLSVLSVVFGLVVYRNPKKPAAPSEEERLKEFGERAILSVEATENQGSP